MGTIKGIKSREKSEGKRPRISKSGTSSSRNTRSTDRNERDSTRPARSTYKKNENSDDAPKRSYKSDDGDSRPVRSSYKKDDGDSRPARSSYKKDDRDARPSRSPYKKKEDGDSRPSRGSYNREDRGSRPSRSPYKKKEDGDSRPSRGSYNREDRDSRPSRSPYKKKEDGDSRPSRGSYKKDDSETRPARTGFRKDDSYQRTDSKRKIITTSAKSSEKSYSSKRNTDEFVDSEGYKDKDQSGKSGAGLRGERHSRPYERKYVRKDAPSGGTYNKRKITTKSSDKKKVFRPDDGKVRLNKYIANTGVCSRREADELIKTGVVSVNGTIVTELGIKVMPGVDEIKYNGAKIKEERKVYVLLNKPKDYVTTVEDPFAKRTVMELIKSACKERIYPVGRLDRNTTGLLLFTNDGELTKRLTHPKYNKKKIYHVFLDKSLKKEDLTKISAGIELEDGEVIVDSINYIGEDKNQVGIEIHSGKNRVVRRIFESLNYNVTKLDRVYFAGLTKKGLDRGHWRHLTEQEINMLKSNMYE